MLNAERGDVGLGQVDTNTQPSQTRDRGSAIAPNKINRDQKEQIGWLLFTGVVFVGIALPIAVSRAVGHAESLQSTDASRQGAKRDRVESGRAESQC